MVTIKSVRKFCKLLQNTGLYALISSGGIGAVKTIIMIAIACVLLYLAIVKIRAVIATSDCVRYAFVKLTDD